MAYTSDQKPTGLTALTTLASDDTIIVGDTSDVNEVVKKITKSNLITDLGSSFANASHTHTASEVTDFDTEVSNNTDVAANTAARHDAVTVTDSSEIDFTLTGQNITASIIAGSIDETKLDASTNASLDLADSSLQDSDIGVSVQGYSAVLAATTASFTTADKTKLDGIETGADVTDATNVDAAGAVMNSDTSTVAMSFVVDEDNMASNSATKVPTQQSVKAYVDAQLSSGVSDGDKGDITVTSGVWNIDAGVVTETELNTTVNASLDLADSSVQPGDNISTLTNDAGFITSESDPVVGAISGLVKANGLGTISAAVADTDYLTPGTAASTYQPLDADLTAIGALAKTDGNIIVGNGTTWVAESGATARASLGLTIGTDVQAYDADLTTWAGVTPGTGVTTFLSTPSSANLAAAVTDETGSGALVFATSPTLVTPTLGVMSYTQATGTVVNLGNLGATEAINWAAGVIQYGTLDSNVTITHTNEVSGRTITLHLAYDATAQRTITWSDVDRWTDNSSGAAPTTPSASGQVLTVTLQYYGTTCVASATGNYAVYA